MRFTVYQTTNLVNGKIYVGVHATEDPNDSYLGSGHLIQQAIKKHGRENFRKEVLFDFDNEAAMEAKEREIVTREFVDREDTYNLVPGGYQGDSYYQALKQLTPEFRRQRSAHANAVLEARRREDPAIRLSQQRAGSRTLELLSQEGRLRGSAFKGHRHSPATRAKMAAAAEKRTGERNSQHGTAWVFHPASGAKKVPAQEVPNYLSLGWRRGRK